MNLAIRHFAVTLILATTAGALPGCGTNTAPKIADPVQIEQERQKYEEMARQERTG